MFGPLPTLHRIFIVGVVITGATVIGLWLGRTPAVPMLVPTATTLSVAAGLALSWLMVGTHSSNGTRRDG